MGQQGRSRPEARPRSLLVCSPRWWYRYRSRRRLDPGGTGGPGRVVTPGNFLECPVAARPPGATPRQGFFREFNVQPARAGFLPWRSTLLQLKEKVNAPPTAAHEAVVLTGAGPASRDGFHYDAPWLILPVKWWVQGKFSRGPAGGARRPRPGAGAEARRRSPKIQGLPWL